jgi:uncharacterized damage-inducible protein DinB
MEIIEMFLEEFDREAAIIRKMLERIPNDKYDWKPRPKSMSIRSIATHIAELPGWVTMGLTTGGLDFANNLFEPAAINTTTELLAYFEKNFANGRKLLAAANEEMMHQEWTVSNGGAIFMTNTKADVIRVSICQITQHRVQLGMLLRSLNIATTGSYAPDTNKVKFELQEQ